MTNTARSRHLQVGVGVVAIVVVVGAAVWRASSPAPATPPSAAVVDVIVHDCPNYKTAQELRKLLEWSFGAAHVQQVSVREGECLLRVTGEVGRTVADLLDDERVINRVVNVGDVTDATVHVTIEGT